MTDFVVNDCVKFAGRHREVTKIEEQLNGGHLLMSPLQRDSFANPPWPSPTRQLDKYE
ncbi:hypothetical protein SAMN04487946_12218 [Halobellus clavatus]|uniref:Uncharacterized protein n=1 Tax=Halobellus clavatus TaxID=660517 RepID=A0A1H3KTC0_9EURY|nr:hypothetical protein SAMN04487946_12218 [Halobellus clavatus]